MKTRRTPGWVVMLGTLVAATGCVTEERRETVPPGTNVAPGPNSNGTDLRESKEPVGGHTDAASRPAAPLFVLPDQNGATMRLVDQEGGWVVLYFYPKDDTPGCTLEAQEFTAIRQEFIDAGAVVWGVSPDSVESHRAFEAKCSLGVTLLSDETHEVATAYGAWQEADEAAGKPARLVRSTVLIDPHGRIARQWPTVSVQGHAAEVLATLRELQK